MKHLARLLLGFQILLPTFTASASLADVVITPKNLTSTRFVQKQCRRNAGEIILRLCSLCYLATPISEGRVRLQLTACYVHLLLVYV